VDQKEILGHLIDSAFNNQQRFVRAQLASEYVGPGLRAGGLGGRERLSRAALARAGEVWVAANRHMAAVIERVPACEARDAVHDRRRQAVDARVRDAGLPRPHEAPPGADRGRLKRCERGFDGSTLMDERSSVRSEAP
jgi:hypothetical protein